MLIRIYGFLVMLYGPREGGKIPRGMSFMSHPTSIDGGSQSSRGPAKNGEEMTACGRESNEKIFTMLVAKGTGPEKVVIGAKYAD
jgi:hypothetical protein